MKMIAWMTLAALLLVGVARGEPLVDVSLVATDRVEVGKPVFVDVVLGSEVPVVVGATHVVITWNPDELELVSWVGGVWAIDGFWGDEFDDDWNNPCIGQPNPFDLCIPANDGNAVVTAVAGNPPTVDGPKSVLVGTLEFIALVAGDLEIEIRKQLGEAVTDVAEMGGLPDVRKRVRGTTVRARR